jgi:hypothetical protein
MRIRKKEPSVGILGKIVNSFSSSKNDTYSCNEINKIPMKVLPENTNIDEILDNGNFAIFNAKGTLPSGFNLDDNNVFVESNLWYSDFGVQTLKSVRSQKRWIRHRANGVWGEWSFENAYSTEETFTGKYWIDGKKIYRRIYTGNLPTTSDWKILFTLPPGYTEITDTHITFKNTYGTFYKGPYYEDNEYYVLLSIEANNTRGVYIKAKGFNGFPYTIVIEYTK